MSHVTWSYNYLPPSYDKVRYFGTIKDVQLGLSIRKSRFFWKSLLELLSNNRNVLGITNFQWTPEDNAVTFTIQQNFYQYYREDMRPMDHFANVEYKVIDEEFAFQLDFVPYNSDTLNNVLKTTIDRAIANHIQSYEEERRATSALAQTSHLNYDFTSADDSKRGRFEVPLTLEDKRNEALGIFLNNRQEIVKEIARRPLAPGTEGPERRGLVPIKHDPRNQAAQFNREMMRRGAFMTSSLQ